jgi:hypothetical protein
MPRPRSESLTEEVAEEPIAIETAGKLEYATAMATEEACRERARACTAPPTAATAPTERPPAPGAAAETEIAAAEVPTCTIAGEAAGMKRRAGPTPGPGTPEAMAGDRQASRQAVAAFSPRSRSSLCYVNGIEDLT